MNGDVVARNSEPEPSLAPPSCTNLVRRTVDFGVVRAGAVPADIGPSNADLDAPTVLASVLSGGSRGA